MVPSRSSTCATSACRLARRLPEPGNRRGARRICRGVRRALPMGSVLYAGERDVRLRPDQRARGHVERAGRDEALSPRGVQPRPGQRRHDPTRSWPPAGRGFRQQRKRRILPALLPDPRSGASPRSRTSGASCRSTSSTLIRCSENMRAHLREHGIPDDDIDWFMAQRCRAARSSGSIITNGTSS